MLPSTIQVAAFVGLLYVCTVPAASAAYAGGAGLPSLLLGGLQNLQGDGDLALDTDLHHLLLALEKNSELPLGDAAGLASSVKSTALLMRILDVARMGVNGPAKNNNSNCAACTIVVSILTQKVLMAGDSLQDGLHAVCKSFTNTSLNNACMLMESVFEALILELGQKTSPDALCAQMKLCVNPQCKLYTVWPPPSLSPLMQSMGQKNHRSDATLRASAADRQRRATAPRRFANNMFRISGYVPSDPATGNFMDDFAQILRFLTGGIQADAEQVFDKHLPMKLDDMDGDTFSTAATLRGFSWRGRDCNDNSSSVYPGRSSSTAPASVDHDCNGISGTNPSGQSYQEMFCSTSDQRGVVILGDSAAAHFSLPPQYFTAADYNNSIFKGILHHVENEFDWPACSWSTGHENNSNCPSTPGLPIESIYGHMFERNRCNHRDYQNIGVNGARVSSMAEKIIQSFRRNQTDDHPALVFFALIGNDVCNSHPGLGHMTTPPEFEASVLQSLQYLDTVLPNKSHVVFMPLADGELLYEFLHNRTHPLQTSYEDLYEFLACMELTPCWGWMNNNATWRLLTNQRAKNLSAVYPKIISEHTYKHFDMHMIPEDYFAKLAAKWVAAGNDPADLIEPVDGFHPSQTGNILIAREVWSWLESTVPDAIGPVNPNNAEIQKIFGNQGGY